MEKYVSFRIQKKENARVMAAINHDMRNGYIPKYINQNKTKNNILLFGQKMDIEARNNLLIEQNKRSKRKLQKNVERFSAGIMTFSKTMKKDYENNPELFKKCSIDFMEKLQGEYGLQIIYGELHVDETTPHIHLLFDNINKANGKSIRRNINPKILSQIQTQMGQSFTQMGYKRGVDKNITNAKNVPVCGLHDLEKVKNKKIEEIEAQKEIKEQLKTDNGTLIKLFTDIMDAKPLTMEQKELLKDMVPVMFQFISPTDLKAKQKLSNNINKALKM